MSHLINANAPIDPEGAMRFAVPVEWIEASAEEIAAAAKDPAADKPAPRFSMIAYTGDRMNLGWEHPVVIDLAGMEIPTRSIPILRDHMRSMIVGHTEKIEIKGGKLRIQGVISGAGQIAREVVESSRRGFPWQASVGANATRVEHIAEGQQVTVNGRRFDGPIIVARATTLHESSFVAIGADQHTSSAVAAQLTEKIMDFSKWLESKGFDPKTLTDAQRTSLQAAYDAERKAAEKPPAAPAATTTTAVVAAADPAKPDVIATIRREATDETKRINAIRKVCDGKHADIEAKAIEEGWTAEKTELTVLRAARPTAAGVRTSAGEAINAQAVEASMLMANGMSEKQVGQWYDQKVMNEATSRHIRGMGIHALLFAVMSAASMPAAAGRIDNDAIRAAYEANARLIQAGSGFSTISLTGILSNVANKSMLAAYEAVDSVVAKICAEEDATDFKTYTRYRMTGLGTIEKVGAGGELKHGTLDEDAYTNKVETYGKMLALTRQMIINDDLGAFLEIPRTMGRMAALAREEAVFTLLLSNPSSFFHANNKNLLTGGGSALALAGLTAAEQQFADQTDKAGKPVLVTPKTLLVPTALKVTAQQLMVSTHLTSGAAAPGVPAANPHAGKWEPVASPYLNSQGLSGQSATAWYLFANPADVAAMAIAYLRGKRTPTIESGETSFNTLGMQWRCFFDFGVAMRDFRGAQKNNGA